ncbi:hypothetical protein Scep_007306 [Stephania cephalantha]|uniref:Uncharacterized protein n=1 Tax=Stephania cephalantha TaxID=152367 RepID=A0AAP0KBL0_9MAGN
MNMLSMPPPHVPFGQPHTGIQFLGRFNLRYFEALVPEIHAWRDLQAVQFLCNSNPLSVNSRDKHSRTPLHLAAWSGQTEVVRHLCMHRADVGAAAMDDMGAIHFAAQKGHVEIVRILLSSGVSIKASNRKGFTALHYAVQGSHMELIKYLVRKGASLTAETKAGKTPLDLASSEEVRSLLSECDLSSKKGEDLKSEEENEEVDTKPADEDVAAHPSDEAATEHEEKESNNEDEEVKRNIEEEVAVDLPKPKKARVALNHLLAADDMAEEES